MVAASAARRGWRWPGGLLLIVVWLVVYATRPLTLGFGDDDWWVLLLPAQQTAAFSWGRLAWFMELYANRPVLGVTTYLISSLCNESAPAWHAAMSVLALLTAFVLRSFFRALLRLADAGRPWAAELAASLWLAFPWMLGTTAWPTLAPALVSLIFLVLAGRTLFVGWRAGEAVWLLPAALFLASCLTYEAFYGQFVTLLLIGLACGVHGRIGWGGLAPAGASLVIVQALAVGWNRVAPLFSSTAPSKSFDSEWLTLTVANGRGLLYLVRRSAPEVSPALELILVAAAACWLVLLLRRRRATALRGLALLAACGVGIVGSCALAAIVGYRITGLGHPARMTLGVSLWFAVGAAVMLGLLPRQARHARLAGTGVTLVAIGLLVGATRARLEDWRETWELVSRTLAEAPVEQLAAADPNAVVLLAGPHLHKGVVVFAHTWDLDEAMRYHYPELSVGKFLPARGDTQTTWDGDVLRQTRLRATEPFFEIQTPEVWVWRPERRSAELMGAPMSFSLQTADP
jgi:hypothetical protein